jgi:hypothetical protein
MSLEVASSWDSRKPQRYSPRQSAGFDWHPPCSIRICYHQGNVSDLIRNLVPTLMKDKPQTPSNTRAVSFVLVAILLAAALPIVAPLLRGNEALAETIVTEPNAVSVAGAAPVARVLPRAVLPPVSSTITPTITQTFSQTYTQAISMMLVGTLLIAIGAVVRRGI